MERLQYFQHVSFRKKEPQQQHLPTEHQAKNAEVDAIKSEMVSQGGAIVTELRSLLQGLGSSMPSIHVYIYINKHTHTLIIMYPEDKYLPKRNILRQPNKAMQNHAHVS